MQGTQTKITLYGLLQGLKINKRKLSRDENEKSIYKSSSELWNVLNDSFIVMEIPWTIDFLGGLRSSFQLIPIKNKDNDIETQENEIAIFIKTFLLEY